MRGCHVSNLKFTPTSAQRPGDGTRVGLLALCIKQDPDPCSVLMLGLGGGWGVQAARDITFHERQRTWPAETHCRHISQPMLQLLPGTRYMHRGHVHCVVKSRRSRCQLGSVTLWGLEILPGNDIETVDRMHTHCKHTAKQNKPGRLAFISTTVEIEPLQKCCRRWHHHGPANGCQRAFQVNWNLNWSDCGLDCLKFQPTPTGQLINGGGIARIQRKCRAEI
eukprot:365021-Chlamydomonas_euryale.AAC.4